MLDNNERENMNGVGYNTEKISNQIINEEAEKIAKEVSGSEPEAQSVQNVRDNISIGPNGLYNMSQPETNTVNDTQVDNSQMNNQQYGGYQSNDNGFGNMGGFNGSFTSAFDNSMYQMNNKNNKNKKATKKMPIFKKFVLSAAAIALIVVSCYGGYTGYNKYKDLNDKVNKLSANKETESQLKLTTSNKNKDKVVVNEGGGIVMTDVSGVVSDVMPSIVAITSKYIVDNYGGFGGWWFGDDNNQQYEQEGAGSGIIVGKTDSELLIVTNNHVVADADSLSVKFIDDKSVEAKVKGTDADRDLAIVAIPLDSIESDTLSAIKVATLGDSDDLSVGDGVIAIGNALGYGQSVTTGVVSALNREVNIEDRTLNLIQTDAAINGGNSGGALINANGEVIGINAAKYSSDGYSGSASIEGMGFAIPISSALDRINELMNKETREKVDEEKRGFLGISGKTVSEENEETFGIPVGVYVINVIEGGAADKAGIQAKDIIVAIDGESVKKMEELQERLEYYSVNDKIEVTIKYLDGREYKEKKVDVVLKGASTLPSESDDRSDR